MDYEEDIKKFIDQEGNPVVLLFQSVPTFDFSDREYDSYRALFIVEKNQRLTGYLFAGGYRLAKVTKYSCLTLADEKTKELFEALEMITSPKVKGDGWFQKFLGKFR